MLSLYLKTEIVQVISLLFLSGGKQQKLEDFKGRNTSFAAKVPAWKREARFAISSQDDDTWYIATNLATTGIAETYAKRFKIEKLFQDIKSSGFDIEKTKIRKYDRFKRLLCLVFLAHAITTFVGFFVKFCKKNYANHWDALTVCSNSVDLLSTSAK
jgi:transposase